MKERPINMKAEEVRAILDGRKTQFRRVVKWPLTSQSDGSKKRMLIEADAPLLVEILKENTRRHPHLQFRQLGQTGDRLWVRETWARNSGTAGGCLYKCDYGNAKSLHTRCLKTGKWIHEVDRWQSPVTMPREASRIWLEIQSVRVERLQDISEEDAKAEGLQPTVPLYGDCGGYVHEGHRDAFFQLWQSIHGPDSWDENPWVRAVEFRRLEGAQ